MQQISLNKICEILGVGNPFEDKEIEYICFNQKFLRSNSLYFTIITEGFEGYKFDYKKIKDLGCIVVTTKQIEDLPCIIVENTLASLYTIASYCRGLYANTKTVVVTGSIGKTSAKEMVYSVLSAGAKTIRNAGSANSTRETCRLMFNLEDEKFALMELGLRAPNMPFRAASKILSPDALMITNIGYSHIENFKNKAQILEHKLSAADSMSPDGVLFLNGDDELLYNSKYDYKTVFFAIKNKNADYFAEDINMDNNGCDFRVVSKDGKTNIAVHLNVPGEHNILNALGAIAISKHFNISDADIVKGAGNFKTTGFRQNVVRGYKNNIIIADCYNATPESMISGFEMLKNVDCTGRKIAVLGHMMRLGRLSEELHRRTGKDVIHYKFDLIITFGQDAHYIFDEVKKSGGNVLEFFTKSDLVAFLRSYVQENDAILFKGVEKFHHFQDLYFDFINPEYAIKTNEYSGLFAGDITCHSDARAIYFADSTNCYVCKNEHRRIFVKDLALIVLAVMVVENSKLSDRVTISKSAAEKFVENTGIRFNPTNIFTVRDLLYAVMFKSSFEASYALIEHVYGDFDNFSNILNVKFRELGIHDTKISEFSNNVCENTYTTAYDMFLITKYALQNEEFTSLIKTVKYTLNNLKSGKQTPIVVNNKLLVSETKSAYLNYFADFAVGVKAENIYSDSNIISNKSLISAANNTSGFVIGVILGSDEFYYCNNSYIDMKRILQCCIAYK